jgi:hypothetical protein
MKILTTSVEVSKVDASWRSQKATKSISKYPQPSSNHITFVSLLSLSKFPSKTELKSTNPSKLTHKPTITPLNFSQSTLRVGATKNVRNCMKSIKSIDNHVSNKSLNGDNKEKESKEIQ